jgi:hypothetical protein
MARVTMGFVMGPGVEPDDISEFLISSKEMVKARQSGLRDVKVDFDASNPSKGEIQAVFNDLPSSKNFAEEFENANVGNERFKLIGPAKIMVSSWRLNGILSGRAASF